MAYYQLRLPEEMDLEGLLKRTAEGQLNVLKARGLAWPGGQAESEKELRKVFDKHVSSFDTCGCSSVCDEQVSPSEWNPAADSRLISTAPADREQVKRFHLRIFHGGLETLAQSTARFVIHVSANQHAPQAAEAEQDLAQAFEAELGPYLFQSQLCKHLELCKSAQPVNPWQLS
jgi:hypothetical protein